MIPFRFWPESASNEALTVDSMAISLLVVCGLITLLVGGLVVFFSIRYHEDTSARRARGGEHHVRVETAFILMIALVFLGMFGWGAGSFVHSHEWPNDPYRITVVGKQWMWKFQHPDGRRELAELHVPVGHPILLMMASEDVIHSLFIPAFRIKQDVVPGRYTYVWFQATRPGSYDLFCTQYCGTAHADMTARVTALSSDAFARWLATGDAGSRVPVVQRGRELFHSHGCESCHLSSAPAEGMPGGPIKAPSLSGLYGARVRLSTGEVVVADENYLRESIVNPRAKIVAGYEPVMPSFSGQFTEDQLLELIAFLKAYPAEGTQ